MAELDDLSGRMLGEFVLRQRIDEGGFGAVYRCEQPLLGREAVVKVLHRGLRRQDGALKRFLREAQLASRLNHPYAAHVYAFGVEEDDEILWIAMEMVHGVTLKDWLKKYGPMPLDEFVPFFERVAEVVQAAHDSGIVHRDLKPSNVMVIEHAGRMLPKLLDFGIAKLLNDVPNTDLPAPQWPSAPAGHIDPTLAETLEDAERTPAMRATPRRPAPHRITGADVAIGSPPYMSPEQWDNPTAVGPASDLYSLGIIAYEALTGRRPFTADTIEDYSVAHRSAPVPPLGDGFSPTLERLLQRALAKQPDDRWTSPLDLAAALRAELKTRMRSQVRAAAHQWADRGRSPDLLWRGTVLAELETWRAASKPQLDEIEAEFLKASQAAKLAAEVARRQRASRIRRWLVAGVAAAALAAIQYRSYLKAEMAQQVADATITQAEIEQGRQALLHGESAEAQTHLWQAYQRGARTPDVEFMLARALQPRMAEKARFQATYGRMWSAVFSPDGSRIVTTDDRAAQIWDASTHKLQLTLTHGDIVYQAAYTHDGTRVVTASRDGSVRIWNATTGVLLHELRSDPHETRPVPYYRVVLSPDDHLIAASDLHGEVVHLWDSLTGAKIKEFYGSDSDSPSLAFSVDGRWFATSGHDVCVFDTTTWSQVFTIGSVRAAKLSFDPVASRLLIGTISGDVSLWEIPSGKRVHHLREIGESVDAVAFAPDGKLIVAASRDGSEQVWDARSGRLQTQFNHHHGRINTVEFDHGSRLVLSAGAEGTIGISDVRLGMAVTALEGPRSAVWSAHFDPSSRSVVAASWDGTARVWDTTSPYRRWSTPTVSDNCGVVASLQPDRRVVAVSCLERPTQVWDTARGELLAELPNVTPVEGEDFGSTFAAVSAEGDRAAILRGSDVEIYALPGGRLIRSIRHPAPVRTVSFGPAGHDLVSGSIDGVVLVTRDDQPPFELARASGAIDAAAFLADGRVVTSDAMRRLRIHDAQHRAVLADLAAPIRAMLLRPSERGDRLLMLGTYTSAELPALWDIKKYRLVARLEGHVGLVRSARYIRGDSEILTTGADGTVRLWAASDGRSLQTYRGSARFLADASLDPTGMMVVAGGGDGLLRFWDATTGRALWTLPAHKSFIVGLHFEGEEIVTRGFAGELARWNLARPQNIIEGCRADRTQKYGACIMMPR